MRKITAGLFISSTASSRIRSGTSRTSDDEMGAAVDRRLAAADTVLLGGRPTTALPVHGRTGRPQARRTRPWARRSAMPGRSSSPTRIFSSHWRNSEQLRGDLAEAVTALKNRPGVTDIAMSGSISIVRQLLDAGLLDELHGTSTHRHAARAPAERGESPIPLLLVSSQAFTTGVLYLIYARSESTPVGTYEDAKARPCRRPDSWNRRSHTRRPVGGTVIQREQAQRVRGSSPRKCSSAC